MKTLNETVLELYKNFKGYAKDHTLVEVAEHIYPDWTIVKLSDMSLVVTMLIETSEGYFEFRVQVAKGASVTNVFVRYEKIKD